MKILCKVALISQTPRSGEDGEALKTTLVKLTPVNLPAGDIQLSFSKADVVFHPEHTLRDPKNPRVETKVMIAKEALIQEATCYVKGEPVVTFKASYPAHPGHTDIANPVEAFPGRDAGEYFVEFTPAT